ncbi:DUF2254 domain-containing protein [Streptomyces sp. NPDC090306]|uniref:DUF2254 domain-containing protein n=1 Tax=Streptomyces sp. NPDC090306 TaxID=3365961 RepID=UPI00382B031C
MTRPPPAAQSPSPPSPDRTRLPHGNGRSQRARRARGNGIALLLVVAGALLGWALPAAERHLPAPALDFDAATAQATLAAIAGGMITLAGFVVTAITLVVQTVQTMSPRLVAALGHFSRHLVLFGLLIGTALYALVTLSQVRGEHVPRFTVTIAVGLVLVDAVTVLYLLASLRHAVTGGGLARAVGIRLRQVVDGTCPAEAEHPPAPGPAVRTGTSVPVVRRGPPAVVLAVDEPRLTKLAARHDLHVQLLYAVGEFTGDGAPVARVDVEGELDPRTVRQVAACVRYGPGRTMEQDSSYGLRLLADIAIRALSPAVNDPATAVQALDHVEEGLVQLAGRPLGPVRLLDDRGVPRVSCPAPEWADFVSLALDETLLYGSSNPQVVRRLRALLDRVAAAAPEHRRLPLTERRDALDRLSDGALPDPLLRRVAARPDPQGLGGRSPSPSPAADG